MTEQIIQASSHLAPETLVKTLTGELGYVLVRELENPGQASRRGGDILLWPAFAEAASRLSFFGDTLEEIRSLGSKTTKDKLIIEPAWLDLDGSKVKPDDILVHIGHGIGRFVAKIAKQVGGESKPYLHIAYQDNAALFVPAARTDLLSPYIGVGRAPRLSKLGSGSWQRTKARVEHSVEYLAKDLLKVAAARELKKVPTFDWPDEWETTLEISFPYTLTADQLTALGATLADLRTGRPMDRLIAGDVGFGKTEVAIRIAAAVVGAGHQVALLAPTTLLVEQHLATLENRLSGLPVSVKRLSRFASREEVAAVKQGLANGTVDIVVGTHSLLAGDICFKRLGLIVTDEEQKFGVKQKERLKQLRTDVHVLALSATPIPRTLFMALSGIRDLSLIQTPPLERLPIETTVLEASDQPIVHAVKREIKRGGQVYIVHNEVQTIQARRQELERLLPGVRILVGHGQMDEGQLGQIMHDFTLGGANVLLCSTIIEAGLDLPNVNTLVVERSERFGLADLYQLRGRVGRANRQAYALLLYTTHTLHGPAKERLQALVEMTELGHGYQVATRDLEIRGGGNILGREQHGNMEAIGLMLYTKLLQQAVKRLKAT